MKNRIIPWFFMLIGIVLVTISSVAQNSAALKSKENTLFSVPVIIPLPSTCLGQATAVKIIDFNNDDFNDILVVTSAGNPAGRELLIYSQNPNAPGSFNYPQIINYNNQDFGASSVDVADLNNDNFPEVVLAIGDYVHIFHNSYGSLVAVEPIIVGSGLTTIKIGEVTNDSLPDIVVSTKNDDCLGVLINQGNLQFVGVGYLAIHSSANNQLAITDQNNDGKNDVVLLRGNSPTNTIAIYYQLDQGGLGLPVYLDLGESANVLAVGSLDSSPGIDIAVTSEPEANAGRLSVWSSANLSASPSLTSISPNTAAMVVTDFDQDGVSEIIAAHRNSNMISTLWCNSNFVIGASAFCYTNLSSQDPHNTLAAGDLNDDGTPDLAIADSSLGLIIMFNQNSITGLNILQNNQLFAVYPNPFKEQLVVKIKEPGVLTRINVYNALGQKTTSFSLTDAAIINTSQWSPGFYTIEAASGEKRELIKTLKTP